MKVKYVSQITCLDANKSLLRSARLGHIVMLHETLKCPNSDINDQGADKNALFIGSELGHKDFVKEIISYDNIDINKRNTYYGKTAIFVAAEKEKLAVIKVLKNHSDIGINLGRTSDGKTAFSSVTLPFRS